eukprot:721596-Heterocapsa_arctica.AAC.1
MDTGHTRSIRLLIPEGITRQQLHVGDTIESMRIIDTKREHIIAEIGPIELTSEALAEKQAGSQRDSSVPTSGTSNTSTRKRSRRSNRDKSRSHRNAPSLADPTWLQIN